MSTLYFTPGHPNINYFNTGGELWKLPSGGVPELVYTFPNAHFITCIHYDSPNILIGVFDVGGVSNEIWELDPTDDSLNLRASFNYDNDEPSYGEPVFQIVKFGEWYYACCAGSDYSPYVARFKLDGTTEAVKASATDWDTNAGAGGIALQGTTLYFLDGYRLYSSVDGTTWNLHTNFTTYDSRYQMASMVTKDDVIYIGGGDDPDDEGCTAVVYKLDAGVISKIRDDTPDASCNVYGQYLGFLGSTLFSTECGWWTGASPVDQRLWNMVAENNWSLKDSVVGNYLAPQQRMVEMGGKLYCLLEYMGGQPPNFYPPPAGGHTELFYWDGVAWTSVQSWIDYTLWDICVFIIAALDVAETSNPPVINTVSPSAVCRGGLITIEGSNFGVSQGSVKLGDIFLEVFVWSDTSIICRLPTYTSSGTFDLIVIDSSGVESDAVSLTVDNCVSISFVLGVGGMPDIVRSDYSRVFLIEYKAGPANAPQFMGWWRAGALTWDQGDVTSVYVPDDTQYGKFKVVGKIPGEPSNPQLAINARYQMDLSELLKLVRNGCDHDLQVHFGKCIDPRDFNGGWEKVLILEDAHAGGYDTDELGALEPSQRVAVGESSTFIGTDAYEIKRLAFTSKADTLVDHDVLDIWFCDTKSCGECGDPSDGCQIIMAITGANGDSPGITAEIVYSQDGGLTWASQNLGLGAAEDANAGSCIGSQVVIVAGGTTCGLRVADTSDFLLGTPTWATVTTGFVASKCPNAIFSLGPSLTWVVGDGGYVYFSEKIDDGVSVQDAGTATAQDLNSIHGLDMNNLLAVGASNAVIYTRNGGTTWTAVTGPAVGVVLKCCWMKGEDEWWVGTAGGKLYYTKDAGVTWVEKTFSGSGAGSVNDIAFATPSIGYIVHTTAAPIGRILRTIDGGHSWYVLPEGTGSIPTNKGLNTVAVCTDPNLVYAGGILSTSGAYDGIIIQGA